MSKYFVEPIIPRPAPTMQERIEFAIRDMEKRIDALEKINKEHPPHSPEFEAKLFALVRG